MQASRVSASKARDIPSSCRRKSSAAKEFDIHTTGVHDDPVKNPARTILLFIAATMVAWQGVVLSIPHDHADTSVPQEELLCSASHPSSDANHFHASGRLLSQHPCLACLAGSTNAEAPGIAEIEETAVDGSAVVITASDLRSRLRSHLPPLRGPPLTT
jgi:hypothetical protein